MPTTSTAPLLALIVFLWYRTEGNVLSIVLFTSVFEAASAANFGNLGVSPPLFALLLCLGFTALHGRKPMRFVNGINRVSLYLLVIFGVYAVLTGIAYPIIFGDIPMIHGGTVTTLAWSTSNFAQICYLLASMLIYFLTISSSRDELRDAIDWYIYGCILSTIFAVYQLASAILHIPYPESILYSNTGHVIYRAYMINGMWRLNSTFPEASEFSTFITVAIGLLGWQVVTRPISLWRVLCLLLMIIMLIMTESSLGYICFFFTLVVGSTLYILQNIKRRGLVVTHLALALLALSVLTTTLILYSNVRQTTVKLVRATLLDKQSSDSYRERTETHTAAIEMLSRTYYLGAGWGSVRASGLAFVLLGNVGLLGFGIFVAFCASLALPLFRSTQLLFLSNYDLYEQCLFGLGIMLIGLIVAGAEPVQPILWVMFGVATASRMPAQRHDLPNHGKGFWPLQPQRRLLQLEGSNHECYVRAL